MPILDSKYASVVNYHWYYWWYYRWQTRRKSPTKWEVTNETGFTANDFHVELYQREKGVQMNGATVGGEQVTGGSGSMGDRDRNPANDGKNHQANFDMTTTEIADGGKLKLDMDIWLNKRNMLFIDDWWWTFNGDPIGGGGGGGGGGNGADGSTCDSWGWSIGDSIFNSLTNEWDHKVDFSNLGCKAMTLNLFSIKASMDYLGDLTSWVGDIDVINVITTPTILNAGQILSHTVSTNTNYAGGHIYGNISYNDPVTIYFDHPVEQVSELGSIWLMLTSLIGGLIFWRSSNESKPKLL